MVLTSSANFIPSFTREHMAMIRNALFSFLLVAIAATAVITLAPNSVFSAQNSFSAQKTALQTADADVTPHHLVFTKCAVEDCSDTPQ
jgi:hypothetical protein